MIRIFLCLFFLSLSSCATREFVGKKDYIQVSIERKCMRVHNRGNFPFRLNYFADKIYAVTRGNLHELRKDGESFKSWSVLNPGYSVSLDFYSSVSQWDVDSYIVFFGIENLTIPVFPKEKVE